MAERRFGGEAVDSTALPSKFRDQRSRIEVSRTKSSNRSRSGIYLRGRASRPHFMIDRRAIERICNHANLTKHDIVLEIGAGTGNLTDKLLEKSKFVYAIENDFDLIRILRDRFRNSENIKIIQENALRSEFPKFNKVVSNLPYNISRKITEKILGYDFWLGILVYQKEFAEKLVALPGTRNYRFISALAQSVADIDILDTIPPSAFNPVPEVESAIVRIKPFFKPCEGYSNFLHSLFDHRNKKISNMIKKVGIPDAYISKRPFELNPEELKELHSWYLCMQKSK